jgi:hypothetical protein
VSREQRFFPAEDDVREIRIDVCIPGAKSGTKLAIDISQIVSQITYAE